MRKLAFILALFILISPAISTGADVDNPGDNPDVSNPGPVKYNIVIKNPLASGVNNIPDLLDLIINKIINPIGAVVAVLMVMYAGFLYVTAQGAPDKIKAAHQAILYAAVGSAILLGANLIAKAIENTVKSLG